MGRGRVPGALGTSSAAGAAVNQPAPLGADEHGAAADLGLSFDEFKAKVLEAQLRNHVARGRSFCANVPNSELEIIEGKHRMRKAAADSCKSLLNAARAAHADDKSKGVALAVQTTKIGVWSAYRNIAEDTLSWNGTFLDYYNKNRATLEALPGGIHGKRSLQTMLRLMIKYKAAPGYSNHSNGLAVDFTTVHRGKELRAKKAQAERWRGTWLWKWLREHASEFGFKPLSTEEWHWDYDG
jgi:LAS superfamily LD-carboxypeptidase LdcB